MAVVQRLIAIQKRVFTLQWKYQGYQRISKKEAYSLTDQIRRSSLSANICTIEAYRKRIYPNHFISKLTDVDMENSETQGWLAFSKEYNYISGEVYDKLYVLSDEIGRLVRHMVDNPKNSGLVNNKN